MRSGWVVEVSGEMQMFKSSRSRGCRGRTRSDSVMPTTEKHRGMENFNNAAHTQSVRWLSALVFFLVNSEALLSG